MCLLLSWHQKDQKQGHAWWHTLVILDTQESKIGRLWFKTSRYKKVSKTLSQDKLAVGAMKEIEVGELWCPRQKHKTLPEK
jgi:hypothetical protein